MVFARRGERQRAPGRDTGEKAGKDARRAVFLLAPLPAPPFLALADPALFALSQRAGREPFNGRPMTEA